MATGLESTYKILIVDDETVIRELVFQLLERPGWTIDVASGGMQALAMLENDTYDLLVVDKNMPDVSGFDIIVKARETNPGIPTIMITAYPSRDLPDLLKQFAVDACVTKPFDVATFGATVKKLLMRK